jgi:rsbT co-antagonist protein RsbR
MESAIQVFTANLPNYVNRAMELVLEAEVPLYVNMPRDLLHGRVAMAFAALGEDVERATTTAYPGYLRVIGAQRAAQGAPLREIIHGLEYGFQVVSDHFREVFAADPDARLWWEERKHAISYAGVLAVTDAYYTAREAFILEQHDQILRLSAPILQLHAGVLLAPIVGALGPERAAHVLEKLLATIVKQRSHMVIIDVTGMHTDDEGAADHLLHAARAVRLLGAKVCLVGISADNALFLMRGGVSFGDITVLPDLASGVELALRLRRRKPRGAA